MDRIACVTLSELPLQLLLRAHPDWREHPVVVVDKDAPQGVVEWANGAARRYRILPGMRFATALALCTDLRAGELNATLIQECLKEVHPLLLRFSPEVELFGDEAGVCWLNAAGLQHLTPSLVHWAEDLRRVLQQEAALTAHIVVGFSRFGTYAVAKSSAFGPSKCVVFEDMHAEQSALQKVTLEHVGIAPKMRDALYRLGISTIDDFVRLPMGGVKERFGAAVATLHSLARHDRWNPLRPTPLERPIERRWWVEDPEPNVARLFFVMKRLLAEMLAELAQGGQALVELNITFELDNHQKVGTAIHPAVATLDIEQLLELLRLRLSSLQFAAAIQSFHLLAEHVSASTEQLRLFIEHPQRNWAAALRAVARVRAELGDDAVVRACLNQGHMPKAQFSWQPVTEIVGPALAASASTPQMMRRYYDPPKPLSAAPVAEISQRLIVSGGWWRQSIWRDYHFAQCANGEWLWIYFDRHRQRWFVQGQVD